MEKPHPLTQWAINKIKAEYKDDIALLIAVTGHATDGDSHGEVFDYFIPETERGYQLSRTFLLDGIGHDLYPRSWERMEKSITLDEMTIVLANGNILYANHEESADRFLAMQKQLTENLNNPEFVYRKALERMDAAMDLYRNLLFEEKSYRARSQAAYIHLYLSQAVAYLNHTYTDSAIFSEKQAYDSSCQSRMYHCPELVSVPDSFFTYCRRLLTAETPKEIRETIDTLLIVTRKFILGKKPGQNVHCREPENQAVKDGKPDYRGLADWYQELSLTFRRIRFFCKENMPEEAYEDACNLQSELIAIGEEFLIEEFNLLDSFSPGSLGYLSLRSQKIEQAIRKILADHQVCLAEYQSLDELEKGLAAR